MPVAAYSADAGLTTPLTPAQHPWSLYIASVDYIAIADLSSFNLQDNGSGQPASLTVTLLDSGGGYNLASTLAKQMFCQWFKAGVDMPVFSGYLKSINPVADAVFAEYRLTFAHASEVLDWAKPIISESRPVETAQSRILYFLGNYAPFVMVGSIGGSGISLNAAAYSTTTLRAVLDAILLAAGLDIYIDGFGQITTYSGTSGLSAPYTIADAPDYVSSIPAIITLDNDGRTDIDAVYIQGGTPEGSGLVWSTTARRDPPRYVSVNAPECVDAATRNARGASEIASRQNLQRITVTVEGYDGWRAGQTITVTCALLGLSAVQLVISGASATVKTKIGPNGTATSFLEWKLAVGSPNPSFTRAMAALAASRATPGGLIAGGIGGPTQGPVTTASASVQLTTNGIEVSDGSISRVTLGKLPSGDYGLRVVSAGGSIVIIDGASDMFKIAATGTVSGAWPGATATSVMYSAGLPALGNYSGSLPACIFMLAESTVTTFSRFPGSKISVGPNNGLANWNMTSWVQFTSTDPGQISVFLQLECDTQAVSAAITGTMRYYVLQEAGI